jgi:hypothetical protein
MRGILSSSILTIVSALGLMAASSIGVVKSPGEFRLDGSTVRSNATVFDGDVIETSAARSVINIGDTHFAMSPDSRVTIYKDKVQIEKGSGIVSNSADYAVQAGPVRVTPNSSDATLSISVIGDKRVVASALTGGGTVSSAEGVLIAKLNPGMPLEFEGLQGTAEPNVTVTGVLKLGKGADNKDYLTDTVTKVKYLVEGQDVSQYVGKAVTLTGSVSPAPAGVPADQVIHLGTIKKAGAAAAAHGGGGALPPAALAAIIAGVSVTVALVTAQSLGAFSSAPATSTP